MRVLSQLINEHLEKTGKSVREFAKELNIDPAALSLYRQNLTAPPEIEKRILEATSQNVEFEEIEKSPVKYISTQKAADLLGINVLQVREGLKQGIWPFKDFGYAIQYEWSDKFNYVIYKKKFEEFLESIV